MRGGEYFTCNFPRFLRFVFILFTGTTTAIFCVLLLFSGFLTVDRKSFVPAKRQVPIIEKEEDKKIIPDSGLSRIFRKHLAEIPVDVLLAKRSFNNNQIRSMSPLGKWLLAQEGSPPPPSNGANRTYLILIWKHGSFLKRRHIKHFTSNEFSPWDQCSVQNCVLSYDDEDLHRADAVVFHLHRTKGPSELPKRTRTDQRWIFLTDESPYHTFLTGGQKLSDYNGLFNWSMSYRMDSDVPVPYGRTVQVPDNVIPDVIVNRNNAIVRSKTKLIAVMGSNCGGHNGRWSYVKTLKSALRDDLDVIGRCLNGNVTVCPGHFDRDCSALEAYKFYLSFENSNCRDYLTEKVFWNAYGKHAVPIIMGATSRNCQRLLPPRSFLHTDDFAGAKALVDYLRYLDRDDERYLEYHEWRDRYRVINEHGYFGSTSKHYCRVCEALHYNPTAPKVYDKLEEFWSKERDCTPASA